MRTLSAFSVLLLVGAWRILHWHQTWTRTPFGSETEG
jgi:hypothetical protein